MKWPNLPGRGGEKLQLSPAKAALARTVDATISTTTQIVLNAATSFLRVYAINKDVYLKWGTTAVDATNFDQVIPAGQIVDLVPPDETTAVNLIEREASATVIVIEY
jgi:hypothetical protein